MDVKYVLDLFKDLLILIRLMMRNKKLSFLIKKLKLFVIMTRN